MRTATIERNTAETQIKLWIDLDGAGQYEICTGCGFLDHMLNLFARHGRFDLRAECRGDTQVDYHHTVEDMGIALGRAFAAALGDIAAAPGKLPGAEGFQLLPIQRAGPGMGENAADGF